MTYNQCTKDGEIRLTLVENGRVIMEKVGVFHEEFEPGSFVYLWDILIELIAQGKGLDHVGKPGTARRMSEAKAALSKREEIRRYGK